MITLTYRNLKLFFKQKNMVLFSFLGVFIILGLYIIFLGDIWLDYADTIENSKELLNTWVVAGVVSVSTITTSMGAAGIMVEDRVRKNIKDFNVTPIKKSSIAGGYLLSIFVVGFIMSLFAFFLGEIYIVLSGGSFLSPFEFIKMVSIIFLSVMSSGSIVFFIASLISNSGTFSTVSTIIGSLIGFLTGIYLPIGTLPNFVQTIIKLFPVSHSSVLMRQILMGDVIDTSFSNIPMSYVSEFKELMGVTYSIGNVQMSVFMHIAILLFVTIAFYGLGMVRFLKDEK